jgi:hypothetical protein
MVPSETIGHSTRLPDGRCSALILAMLVLDVQGACFHTGEWN